MVFDFGKQKNRPGTGGAGRRGVLEQLTDKLRDEIEDLKRENSALRQRLAEYENPNSPKGFTKNSDSKAAGQGRRFHAARDAILSKLAASNQTPAAKTTLERFQRTTGPQNDLIELVDNKTFTACSSDQKEKGLEREGPNGNKYERDLDGKSGTVTSVVHEKIQQFMKLSQTPEWDRSIPSPRSDGRRPGSSSRIGEDKLAEMTSSDIDYDKEKRIKDLDNENKRTKAKVFELELKILELGRRKRGTVRRVRSSRCGGTDDDGTSNQSDEARHKLEQELKKFKIVESHKHDILGHLYRHSREKSRRNALLKWVKSRLAPYQIKVCDFSRSWKSGLALLYLLHSYTGDMSNLNNTDLNNKRQVYAMVSEISDHHNISLNMYTDYLLSTKTPSWRYIMTLVMVIYEHFEYINDTS